MKIEISRHAKRRIKLYRLDEDEIVEILESNIEEAEMTGEKQVIIKDRLKIVFIKEADIITIITAYPLKKEKKS